MYTPGEIGEVQGGIDEIFDMVSPTETPLEPDRRDEIIKAVQGPDFKDKGAYQFLAPIAVSNPELFKRLIKDPRIAKYSHLAFLPQTVGLVYDSDEDPVMTPMVGTRGAIFRLTHTDGDYITKPYQSNDERRIIPAVTDLGMGPGQFPSTRNVITEEFVHGDTLTRMGSNESPETYQEVGRTIGNYYSQLHARNIFYNDAIADDMGKSHIILNEEDRTPRMIDFGVAIDVSDPSNFTDEQVFTYLRTMAELRLQLDFMGASPESLVEQHRARVRSLAAPDIVKRDLQLIQESLGALVFRIGQAAVENIARGFEETYKAA